MYKDLGVYQRSCALATAVHRTVSGWDNFELWSVGIQAVRAADSIGANIAEGYGRAPTADRRRFVLYARGSAYELEHWLRAAADRGLQLERALAEESGAISRMLNGLLRRMTEQADC